MNELDLKIPEQLSMIGFDNLQFARACSPKLTIVAQPTSGIAREVASIMLKRLGEAGAKKRSRSQRSLARKLLWGNPCVC